MQEQQMSPEMPLEQRVNQAAKEIAQKIGYSKTERMLRNVGSEQIGSLLEAATVMVIDAVYAEQLYKEAQQREVPGPGSANGIMTVEAVGAAAAAEGAWETFYAVARKHQQSGEFLRMGAEVASKLRPLVNDGADLAGFRGKVNRHLRSLVD